MESLISVLAVDDNQPDLELISEAFIDAKIKNFRLFSSANLFIDEVMQSQCPVCIIDHKLGSQMGYDVMLEVRSKVSSTYIIILSGNRDVYKLVEYANAGANKIVLKEDPEYLTKLVEYVNVGIDFQLQYLALKKEIHSL